MDTALNRRLVDVIVVCKARPPTSGQGVFDARVRVGTLDRQVRVFGDRRCWRDAGGNLRFTTPAPVEAVDAGWVSAYGGIDRVALAKHGDPIERHHKELGEPYDPHFGIYVYPRNRAGKGYLIEASTEALEACSLPNLEDPTQLLAPESLAIGRYDRWPTAPMPAALGWLSYNYFPRMAAAWLVPPFDTTEFPASSFWEVRTGVLKPESLALRIALPERFDLGVAQQSAVGMRVAEVMPSALVELGNLHLRHASWAFALSDERPLLALQMPDGPPVNPEPKIRTVLIEPELDRVCITWVGEHREPVPVGPGKAAKIRCAVKWGS
jgi:hypothetical protein